LKKNRHKLEKISEYDKHWEIESESEVGEDRWVNEVKNAKKYDL